MILHIVPDDKFIDMAYNMFEKASPNNNEFMIVGKFDKFKYIKTTPITQVNKLEFLSKNFAKNLENYEFVVIHALIGHSMKLVLNTSSKVRFIWLGWGFDYYCFLDKTLLFSKTAVLKNKLSLNSEFVGKKYLRKLKRFVVNKFFYNGIEHLDRIFEKIDYFAPVLKEDYDLLSKHFQNFQPQYLDWNYGTLEDNLIKEELELSGKNILLGNSASYENNHIEAVDLICNLDLENRKVTS
ncbi:MAG: hypothetical protein PHS78_10115 [Aliarcobacter skirrowii]|uniref:hypothetical protein n=1 Tax=Aliarcobacter skirrowii TaxID=28200 RepID=UPI0024308E73|nr:hypothetical protein [Aliarcobacter skirrowii]MDD2509377.1 hypothetical protein [Aliarcobacter skirrowii]MDD3496990.1 hypothetical protein [Aliarcobacter skirrowii]